MVSAYANFRTPPAEEQFWAWIKEYREHFMLFLYQSNGTLWVQWQSDERYLTSLQIRGRQNKSGAPPTGEEEAYRRR